MSTLTKEPEDDNDYHGSEIVFIDPEEDVYNYEAPIGSEGLAACKTRAAHALAHLIIDNIEPEFIELPNFETMRYTLIIKKYDK